MVQADEDVADYIAVACALRQMTPRARKWTAVAMQLMSNEGKNHKLFYLTVTVLLIVLVAGLATKTNPVLLALALVAGIVLGVLVILKYLGML